MYFDPYIIGFILGIFSGITLIFVILMVAAIVSVNKEKKK